MSLKDILARKSKEKALAMHSPTTKILVTGIPTTEIDPSLFSSKVSYKQPPSDLFLALYTPFIKNPYKFDWFIQRDYKEFLLDSSCYVLNTFTLLDIDKILDLYLLHNPPRTLEAHTKLVFFLNHIHLVIPRIFQTEIELLITTEQEN